MLKLAVGAATFAAVVYCARKHSANKITQKDTNPTIIQYLNRLVEFFEAENLQQAEDEFLSMIDFGKDPKDAFGIMTFTGELN